MLKQELFYCQIKCPSTAPRHCWCTRMAKGWPMVGLPSYFASGKLYQISWNTGCDLPGGNIINTKFKMYRN